MHLRVLYATLDLGFAEQWGAEGVDLFFVISGYCLSYRVLRALRSESASASFDVATYAIRRVWRIVPTFVVAALVLMLAVAGARAHGIDPGAAFVVPQNVVTVGEQIGLFDRNLTFVNPSFWSLALEMRWYVVFPFALVLFVRSRRAFATAFVAALVLLAGTKIWYSLDARYLPVFLSGIVAAEVALRAPKAWWWALPGFALALGYCAIQNRLQPGYGGDRVGWQLACFCLVCSAATFAPLRRALSFAPLAWIGTASYSIYLVHEPLMAVAARTIAQPQAPLAVASLVVLGLAVGFTFYGCVEAPLMLPRLTRAIERRCLPTVERIFAALGVQRRLAFAQPHDDRRADAAHEFVATSVSA